MTQRIAIMQLATTRVFNHWITHGFTFCFLVSTGAFHNLYLIKQCLVSN